MPDWIRERTGNFPDLCNDLTLPSPARARFAHNWDVLLHGLSSQRLALAVGQQPGSAVDEVAAAARPAGGIARPALLPLFYQVEIRHRRLLQ